MARGGSIRLEDDPLWYKDAVIYELHVRAFCDSDGDGVGDFRGLVSKLDYLQDLGVTAVWLLPFYPSPLRDDGYDIADYTAVHPQYGTLRDFQAFLHAAHRRGLRVITELVLNHTSDQHPWFQRARRAKPGSRAREMYVWSDSPDRYRQARVIFKDFEASNWTWDPVARAYYWHRFYSHQPDLNYDNPAVHRAIFRVVDFWLGLGVDGLRLDAVPYLYEREGTSCENLPETIEFLRRLRRHVDGKFRSRMLLAEANQWPEDVVPYLVDACHMAFHFPLMPRLFMALHMEDRFPITEILEQTPAIPEESQWALFLRNHDELTLEMVTDEERDYMYRVYASDPQARVNLGIRRRLAPLLGNQRRRIELMNALLLSLPGTPILYYGDEIGMGDNIYLGDRNGVRTPMQWSADRNAGFSRANPQRLYLPVITDPEYHYEAVNVETQQQNPHSLLWWMKRILRLRRRYRAFGRGDFRALAADNRKVFAFLRTYGDERILVVANLSRFSQFVRLDLADLAGCVPVELFGGTPFPPVTEHPYVLTLGPHGFYWFHLQRETQPVRLDAHVPRAEGDWPEVVRPEGPLDPALASWLPHRRWFGAKARATKAVATEDVLPLHQGLRLALVRVEYREGTPDRYAIPLAVVSREEAQSLRETFPGALVAELPSGRWVVDALAHPPACVAVLEAMVTRRRVRGTKGELVFSAGQPLLQLWRQAGELVPLPVRREQSNSSVVFGSRAIVKLFRRLEEGTNPELEIGRLLTQRRFPHAAAVLGAVEYRSGRGEPATVAVAVEYVPHESDAWQYTVDSVAEFLDRAVASEPPPEDLPEAPWDVPPPPVVAETVGPYVAMARLLGQRTAELHHVLAGSLHPAFAPEPFTPFYQQSLYQSMRGLLRRTYGELRERLHQLPADARPLAERALRLEPLILARFRALRDRPVRALRIRVHGDYHLGQVLYTGRDFVIIDFEGEPARSTTERRIKRSALRDVAGMVRSFHYAAHAGLRRHGAVTSPAESERLRRWAQAWLWAVTHAFVQAYVEAAGAGRFVPESAEERTALLGVFVLEKAVYEIGYELNHRPDWLAVPLDGLEELVAGRAEEVR